MTQLDRIEQKLDALAQMMVTLLESLAEEEQDDAATDLNGVRYGGARNQDDML